MASQLTRALGRLDAGQALTDLSLNCLAALETHYRSQGSHKAEAVTAELLKRLDS